MLRRASEERLNVDYYINPDDPELAEFAGPDAFVENTVDRFVDRVDALIEEEGLE